jgi:hypothetical protein
MCPQLNPWHAGCHSQLSKVNFLLNFGEILKLEVPNQCITEKEFKKKFFIDAKSVKVECFCMD